MENSFEQSLSSTRFIDANISEPLTIRRIDLATFKGFKFIFLDALTIETRDIYDKISGTFAWEICENKDYCINYIREQCSNKLVFLIISGSFGKDVVPEIHNLPQIYAIYIHCAHVQYHLEWSKQYSKIRVVCNDDDQDLIPRFAFDVAQANIEWGDALFQKNQRDKAKQKFEKALDNLTRYAKNPNPLMIKSIKIKIDQCK